jgi:hypothetical protein
MCICNKCNQPKNNCFDPCHNCNNQPVTAPCLPIPCTTGCVQPLKALCTFYNGQTLNCPSLNLEIKSGDSIELIVQKLFTVICQNQNNNCCDFPTLRIIEISNCQDPQYLMIDKIFVNGIELLINTTNFPSISFICGNRFQISIATIAQDILTILQVIDPNITFINVGSDSLIVYSSVNYITFQTSCSNTALC